MFVKKASTRYPIHDLLANRWSGRAYDPEKSLKEEQLITLLEAARWAPSCFGDEPWRFIVCNRDTDKDAWNKSLECLNEKNQAWAKNAPVLIIITANTEFLNNGKQNRWGSYDTGAAALSLCIQAVSMDIMTHQMGGFDMDKARELFAIPDQFIPMSVMAVGYQVSRDEVPDDLKEREFAERRRKPLSECFFNGEWGNGVQ